MSKGEDYGFHDERSSNYYITTLNSGRASSVGNPRTYCNIPDPYCRRNKENIVFTVDQLRSGSPWNHTYTEIDLNSTVYAEIDHNKQVSESSDASQSTHCSLNDHRPLIEQPGSSAPNTKPVTML